MHLGGSRGGFTAIWAAIRRWRFIVFRRGAACCVTPNSEVLGCAGHLRRRVYVHRRCPRHAGPRRKWRPRMVLLTAIFGRSGQRRISWLCRWPHCSVWRHAWSPKAQEPDIACGSVRCGRAGVGLCVLWFSPDASTMSSARRQDPVGLTGPCPAIFGSPPMAASRLPRAPPRCSTWAGKSRYFGTQPAALRFGLYGGDYAGSPGVRGSGRSRFCSRCRRVFAMHTTFRKDAGARAAGAVVALQRCLRAGLRVRVEKKNALEDIRPCGA